MPNVRRLAYRDAYVWSLVQTITGGSSTLPPVTFSPEENTTFLVSWTQEQWNRVFSALITGADLSYPEQSHQVVWDLLQYVEYPMSITQGLSNRGDFFARTGLWNVTPVYNTNTAQPFAYHMNGTGNTQNTQVHWDNVMLVPGDYAIDVLWVRELNSAIAAVSLYSPVSGDVFAGSIDMHGLFANNQMSTLTFTIPDENPRNLNITASSKQAGSSGYRMNITSCHIREV